MNLEELFYLIPYLLSLALSLGIFIYTWQHRFVRGARVYSWFVGGQCLTILGFILELISPNLETKLLWDKFQWLTDSFLVILPFLIFSVQFSEYELRHPRLTWGTWLGLPILFMLVLLTDNFHHLLYQNPHLSLDFPFPELQYDFTIIVYGYTLFYVYGANFYGVSLLIRRALQPYNVHRFQYWTIAIGFLIPVTLSILTLLNFHIVPQRDIAPISFALGNLVVAWGLFRYRLFNLVPIARERVLENLADAIIVLDESNRVVDINQVALANVRKKGTEVIGHPVQEVFKEWSDLVERIQTLDDAVLEISAKVLGELRTYDLSISPIRDQRNHLIGRVFIAHDITRLKMLEERYRQLSEELEERVSERTEDLRKSTIALRESEERLRSFVQQNIDGIILIDPEGVVVEWNIVMEKLSGFSSEEMIGLKIWELHFYINREDQPTPERRRQVEEDYKHILQTGIVPEYVQSRETSLFQKSGGRIFLEQKVFTVKTNKGFWMGVIVRDLSERKRAEKALREKTEELERFFTSALDLLCIADTDGYFRRLNREWEKVLGYRLKDLEGMRFLDLVHPDDQQATLAAMAKLNAQEEVLDFTNRYRCKDGTYRWFEWRSIPHGKLIYASAHDITNRRQAEEALLASEAIYRQAIEVAGAVPYRQSYTADGKLVDYNFIGDGILQITGYTSEEFNATLWDSLVREAHLLEDLAEFSWDEAAQKVRAGDIPVWKCEYLIQARDSTMRWIFESAVEIRDENGISHGSIGLFQDITERRQVEIDLRESEKRYRDLVEFSPVAITVHQEERITYINPAGVKLWGANKQEEVLGRSPLDFVHPDYHELLNERIQQIQTREQSLPPTEVKNIRLDGQMLYTVGTGIPITYQGEPAILSVVLDITERVRAEERLRELTRRLVAAQEEERKHIAQELHDELGQALTAISLDLGSIEKILPPEVPPGIRDQLIDARSLADEVDERIGEIALDLRPSLLDDLGLLPTLQWYLNRYSQRLGIEVSMDSKGLESRLPEEVETTLYRVIQEALTNIARHAQASMVRLSLERSVETVIVSIHDDGKGFDVEGLQSSATLPEGMGLLGINDRVSTLGGRVEIHSKPGQGTHVNIEIPL
jgi:PAS domain S-box-containing protein